MKVVPNFERIVETSIYYAFVIDLFSIENLL